MSEKSGNALGSEESSKKPKMMRTSNQLQQCIDSLNESLISDGEEVFFKELPHEILQLSQRIAVCASICVSGVERKAVSVIARRIEKGTVWRHPGVFSRISEM